MRNVACKGWLLFAAMALLSCATDGVKLPEGKGEGAEYFVLRVPGAAAEAMLTKDGISGSDVQVTRYQDSLRGRAYGMTVEMYWTEEEVKGTVGGSPVDLKVEQGKDAQGKDELRIRGLYAGRVGNFTIKPGKIDGTLGSCSYSMDAWSGGVYVGHMTCGDQPNDANLTLPPTLAMYYPAEIAAHLAVFLGR